MEKKRQEGDDFTPVCAQPGSEAQEAVVLTTLPSKKEIALSSAGSGEDEAPQERRIQLPFDPFRIADAIWRHKGKCIAAGLVLGCAGFVVGMFMIKPNYKSSAVLLRQEVTSTYRASEIGEPYKPLDISTQVLTGSLMRSGMLLDRVTKAMDMPISGRDILDRIEITNERNSSIIRVNYSTEISAAHAATLLGNYTSETIKLVRELESKDASETYALLTQQIERCEEDIAALDKQMVAYMAASSLVDMDKEVSAYLSELSNMELKMHEVRLDYETLDVKIHSIEKELKNVSSAAARLQDAKGELARMRTKYTDQNPMVITQLEVVQNLEDQLAAGGDDGTKYIEPGGNPIAEGLYLSRVEMLSQKDMLGQQLEKFSSVRDSIMAKLNQLPKKNVEFAVIKAKRASMDKARELLTGRQRESAIYVQNPPGRYRILSSPRVEDVISNQNNTLKATLGLGGAIGGCALVMFLVVLREFSDRRIKTAADLHRVTGLPVLASLPAGLRDDAEGRRAWAFRTWTKLHTRLFLGGQATVCGLLSDKSENLPAISSALAEAAAVRDCSVLIISKEVNPDCPVIDIEDAVANAREITDGWLLRNKGIAYVRISEEWAWSATQRQEFQQALNHWSRHPQAIIFVELPPTDRAETLLIAERLPAVIWVGASGQKQDDTLEETLHTYRHAGCRLLGAMMKDTPRLQPAMLNQFATASSLALLVLLAGGVATAALGETRPTVLKANNATDVLPDIRLAPGDSVHLNMFARLGMQRKEVFVQSDGHLTYLQADVMATGLTLDELKDKLNEALSVYHQNPRVMVSPDRFQSRKVYILGKVVKKGMVNFDRPLTLLEAVSEAGGLEIGTFEQNTVELADLGHAFVARGGKKLDVNFEALFYRGDMAQNVALQPDDYVYFPSANSNEVYIMGAVANQGTQGLLGHSTVTSVIAQASGFTDKAYKKKVLVIRGSLEKPEKIVVNMDDILSGQTAGFRLKPKDLIYVSEKPWARAEELLDMAISAFVQGATTGYVSGNIAPAITKPWIQPKYNNR